MGEWDWATKESLRVWNTPGMDATHIAVALREAVEAERKACAEVVRNVAEPGPSPSRSLHVGPIPRLRRTPPMLDEINTPVLGCPFCGAEPSYQHHPETTFSTTHTLGCDACGIQRTAGNLEDVVKLWNTRTQAVLPGGGLETGMETQPKTQATLVAFGPMAGVTIRVDPTIPEGEVHVRHKDTTIARFVV